MTYSTAYNNEKAVQMMLVLDAAPRAVVQIGIHVMFSFDVVENAIQAIAKPAERTQGVNHKKRNKIINNSYKSGDNLKGDEYRFGTELKVDVGYASANLGHIYDVENHMIFKKVQDEIMDLMDTNVELQEMLSDAKPKKFNREKVNRMFKIIYDHFQAKPAARQYMNLIYIFDNVSNLSGLKYASLYDLLDGEYKQRILVELDKHHNILKTSGKSNRLF